MSKNKFSCWWQRYLPQHFLSRFMGLIAECEWPFIKNGFIRTFISRFKVDLSEATITDAKVYKNFNDFFIRQLRPECRPINKDTESIISPVDGNVSEIGIIKRDRLLQAKNHFYSVDALVGDDHALAETFYDGLFLTAYLAPKDYHRIHMPLSGKLIQMIHVPGKLFSVNPGSVNGIPNLFARNERVVCIFDQGDFSFAVIAVGAMLVASIATTWHGLVTPPTHMRIQRWDYRDQPVFLNKGDELGYFKMGSTAIVLLPPGIASWNVNLNANAPLRMGESIGTITTTNKETR